MRKKTSVVGIIITIVILILLVFLSNLKLENISYLENALSKIVMPIQTGYTYLKNKVTGNTSFFTNMEELKTENEKEMLLTRVNSLEMEVRKLKERIERIAWGTPGNGLAAALR